MAQESAKADFQAAALKCSTYFSEFPLDDITNRDASYRAWKAAKQAKSATIRYWISVEYAAEAMRAGRNDEAIDASTIAYEVSDANQDKRRIHLSVATLALAQASLGFYKEALDSNSIALNNATNDWYRLTILMNRGYIHLGANALDSAIEAYQEALKIVDKIKDEYSEITIKINLAEIYARQNKATESERLLQYCLQRAEAIDNKEGVAFSKMFLAILSIRKQRLAEGIALFEEAEPWFIKVGEKEALLGHQKNFARELNENSHYREAYLYLAKANELALTIQDEAKQRDAIFYSATFESQKKDKEIQLLNAEVRNKSFEVELQSLNRQRWVAFGVAIFGICVIVVMAYFQLRGRHNKLEKWSKELDHQSSHDALTDVYNRRYVDRFLASRLYRAQLEPGSESLLLVICDLDHFKKINDTFGHDAGDAVLKESCVRMKSHLRSGDVIARWGGEEFLLLIQYSDAKFAENLIKRMLEVMSNAPIIHAQSSIPVSVSMGFCHYRHGVDAWEASLKLVDRFLYLSKSKGRAQAWGNMEQPVADLLALTDERLVEVCLNIVSHN